MPEISIKAEEIFRIGSFTVTNSVLLAWVTVAVLSGAGFTVRRGLAMIPGKVQSIFELLLEEILALMDSVLGSRRLSERYLPLVATVFLFILTANWLGLFPGIGPVGIWHGTEEHRVLVPLFRAPAADLNFTIALGIISIFSVNLLGILAVGFMKHFRKFFNVSSPVMFFVGILELVSEFVKIVSFSFRLFGNVFAGEVLLTIIAILIPYFVPLPFLLLEIFVGFIQALIFAMLTLVFVGMAVSEEGAH